MEKKILFGSCTYLSYRYGINLTFLRNIFLLLGFFGIGILIYISISFIFIKNKWILQHDKKIQPSPI